MLKQGGLLVGEALLSKLYVYALSGVQWERECVVGNGNTTPTAGWSKVGRCVQR